MTWILRQTQSHRWDLAAAIPFPFASVAALFFLCIVILLLFHYSCCPRRKFLSSPWDFSYHINWITLREYSKKEYKSLVFLLIVFWKSNFSYRNLKEGERVWFFSSALLLPNSCTTKRRGKKKLVAYCMQRNAAMFCIFLSYIVNQRDVANAEPEHTKV